MVFIVIFAGLFLVLWGIFVAAVRPMERALDFLANRIARFRYKDYVPVAILLAAGLAVTAVAADGFEDLATLVRGKSPLLQFVDTQAHDWAVTQRSRQATLFFTTFTTIGSPVGLGIVVGIVAVILLIRKRYRWAAFLVFATGMGGLLVWQLKAYFARARPDLAAALRQADGYSFPSGHAMGSTVVCGALAYLGFRLFKSWRAKGAALAAATTFVLAVAVSRIYLGVHWISDIAAGLSAGLMWVTVATVAYETARRIRLIRELRKRATTPGSR